MLLVWKCTFWTPQILLDLFLFLEGGGGGASHREYFEVFQWISGNFYKVTCTFPTSKNCFATRKKVQTRTKSAESQESAQSFTATQPVTLSAHLHRKEMAGRPTAAATSNPGAAVLRNAKQLTDGSVLYFYH